jgi:type VI secretion system protein ImpL
MGAQIVTAILLLMYLAVAWFAGSLLGLKGTSLWALRAGLSFIGVVAAIFFHWFSKRLKRQGLMSGPNSGLLSQLDFYLQQADAKLKALNGSTLAEQPIVFVLGEANTAKTSIMQHCGLQPELLAGEPERDAQIAATATVNVWWAGNTVFLEAGGLLLNDPALWIYLVRHAQLDPYSAAFRRGAQPARAALVCFDCEHLASGGDAVAAPAKRLNSRLREMAETLGSYIPVYVLFTKMDRVQHFAEFVANLTKEEAAQALGATLEKSSATDNGEPERVGGALDGLLMSLAHKRIEFLKREKAAEKLPSIYEFPREVRKLRAQIVQFLTELARPVQPGVCAFLRGFYFSGVRAVFISETVQAPKAIAAAASVAAATRMFNMEEIQAMVSAPAGPTVQTRKVPEWSFLNNLFSEVILRDTPALTVSERSTKTDQARAFVFAMAAFAAIFVAALLAISWTDNHKLEASVLGAAQQLQGARELAAGQIATTTELRNLDGLRQALVSLEANRKDGTPLAERFGLYSGDSIYDDARKVYFDGFNKLLLGPAKNNMLTQLRALPANPTPANEFGQPYRTLKAYLVITSNNDKAATDFLPAALLERWNLGAGGDDERSKLAKAQFEYYTANLAQTNPIPSAADSGAVQHARQYLKQFNGVDTIYQSMLAEAGRNMQPVNFNRQNAGSAQVIVASHEVPAAFTRQGFAVMQNALRNPDKFYGSEDWVLGQKSAVNLPADKLQEQLRNRYNADYLNQWREFLKSANVAHYGSATDAANKLRVLSGNRSPLMQLFWTVAQNTNVDIPGATRGFDAVQRMVAGGSEDHPIGAAAQTYMAALNGLQGNLTALAGIPDGKPDPATLNLTLVAAGSARASAGQLAQAFLIDPDGHVDSQVRKLLEDPVVSAEGLVRRMAKDQPSK